MYVHLQLEKGQANLFQIWYAHLLKSEIKFRDSLVRLLMRVVFVTGELNMKQARRQEQSCSFRQFPH